MSSEYVKAYVQAEEQLQQLGIENPREELQLAIRSLREEAREEGEEQPGHELLLKESVHRITERVQDQQTEKGVQIVGVHIDPDYGNYANDAYDTPDWDRETESERQQRIKGVYTDEELEDAAKEPFKYWTEEDFETNAKSTSDMPTGEIRERIFDLHRDADTIMTQADSATGEERTALIGQYEAVVTQENELQAAYHERVAPTRVAVEPEPEETGVRMRIN